MTDNDNIRRLLDRFFDGLTTADEERRLYDFFSSPDLPEEFQSQKEMMGWFASGLGSHTESSDTKASAPRRRRFMLRPFHLISAAASLLIFLSLGVLFIRENIERQAQYSLYAGSYIIRDGKKITDLSVVLPEMARVEAEMEMRRCAMTPPPVPEPAELFVSSLENPDRRMVCNILDNQSFNL